MYFLDESGEFFEALKALVEETYSTNNNQAITLITHSLGSTMVLFFLQKQTQEWKDKYIKSFISMSGAWGGSISGLMYSVEGLPLGPRILQINLLTDPMKTFPSLGAGFPSDFLWKPDEVLVESSKRNYTTAEMLQFLTYASK